MHLRHLTLVAFAAPLLFAACSSDDGKGTSNGVQQPGFGLNPGGMQPSAAGDDSATETPDTTPANPGDPGVGNTPGGSEGPSTDIGLQPTNPDMGSSTPGEVTPTPGELEPTPLPPVGTVEDSGIDCQVAALPAGNTLTPSPMLPDPFTRLDGTRITKKSDWTCRREEILQQVYRYIYGEKPRKPDSVTGTVSNTQITVNVQQQGRTASFTANVTLPAGQGPFPAVVSFSGSGPVAQITSMGVALINFNQGSIGGARTGSFSTLYPNNTAGDLAAWAWGASRIVDVLQDADNTIIDSKRLAVTGCSFLGKAAFAAGALDERFALVMPLESGIGGVPSYKIVPVLEPNPTGAGDGPEQPQHAINNGWLPAGSLVADFNRLPVDTHEILGLVAPRGLLVLGNTGTQGQYYKNLDFRSEFATVTVGKQIFEALGVGDRMSYDSRAVNHCQNTDRFTAAVQASVGRFLLNNDATTGTLTTDWEGVRAPADQFVNWTAPTLE